MYKTDNSAVFYRTAEDFYELAMVHGVEEAFKVEVYYIGVALVDYPLRSTQCIMASSSLSELMPSIQNEYSFDAQRSYIHWHLKQASLALEAGFIFFGCYSKKTRFAFIKHK